MDRDLESVLRGGQPSDPNDSENAVTELPDNFTKWVDDNAERIVKSTSMPYFLTDNEQFFSKAVAPSASRLGIIERISHQQFNDYINNYVGRSERFDALYSRFITGEIDEGERILLINQLKKECAQFTISDLRQAGIVNDDFTSTSIKFNEIIRQKRTFKSHGQEIETEELKMDLVVFRDRHGVEFIYPVGSRYVNEFNKPFSTVEASAAIDEMPPYLKKGIKSVSFLSTPNPEDPYWRVEYEKPNFEAFATDGGHTIFWMTPADKDQFKYYMSHETGHIIDRGTHRFSSSAAWKEAVALDDAMYQRYFSNVVIRVTEYAKINDVEDFAECMAAYITDHEHFKEMFPNRTEFIRRMAQKLSGHTS